MPSLDSFPAINASLNGASAVLLAAALALILRGKRTAHQVCMAAAFLVSTTFLACYLYYHFHTGMTRFTAEGWPRAIYYTLLTSHVLLAVTVVPLALTSFWRAHRQDWARHRRISHITWPVWMYVSVTGVVVYAMLYHLYPSSAAAI